MTGWAVVVRCPPDRRDAVAQWLAERTGCAVAELSDGTLSAWMEASGGALDLARAARDAFGPDADARVEEAPPVDWSVAWRDGIAPRRFGRLVVTPSWIPLPEGPGAVVVVLDPETAFGSGEHGSTRTALILLEQLISTGDRVLDLGSGSGILAIAAARLGAIRAVGVEVDEEANRVAERNATRNGVATTVSFVEGDAGSLAPLLGPADVVLANILRTANVQLLPAILASLRPGGMAIFAGMETAEAPLFTPALDRAGFTPRRVAHADGWWGIAASRE